MLNVPVKNIMRAESALQLPPATSVVAATEQMSLRSVGAVMVVEQGNLLGIFTERDVMCRVVAKGLDPNVTQIAEVMTKQPRTVGPEKSYGHALIIMQENHFRHLPVVEGGKLIGIISARNAMDPDLEEFSAEVYRREAMRK